MEVRGAADFALYSSTRPVSVPAAIHLEGLKLRGLGLQKTGHNVLVIRRNCHRRYGMH